MSQPINENSNPADSWDAYRIYVVANLETINERLGRIEASGTDHNVRVTLLENRAKWWGALAGAVVSILASVSQYILMHIDAWAK